MTVHCSSMSIHLPPMSAWLLPRSSSSHVACLLFNSGQRSVTDWLTRPEHLQHVSGILSLNKPQLHDSNAIVGTRLRPRSDVAISGEKIWICAVFASPISCHCVQRWCHPQNWKYTTIAMPPEEERGAATVNMHRNLAKFECLVREICVQTERKTDMLITTLSSMEDEV